MGAHEEVEGRENHNHNPDVSVVNVLRFKQALRSRAANEVISLRNIYVTEEINHHQASLEVGGFHGAIEKMMVRARKTDTPPIPRTFEEIDLILRNPRSGYSDIGVGLGKFKFWLGLNTFVENAQQNLALDGNVHLFLQRMSHAVDGLFNPPLAVDPLVDQVLPAVAADGGQIAEEVHVAPNIRKKLQLFRLHPPQFWMLNVYV
ncbi:hypothetical protein FQR65_LT17534 [Abscondita terminalis]|nr:hypothetical protein FQR65_LT17534 [Abscondita terminalis]